MEKRYFLIFILCAFIDLKAFPQVVQQVPIDAAIRIGRLENGLTYYIRHNEFSKQRAEFFIAQKVGSILEEENQRGLAHFLEHMCFNGTKNFPGNSLIAELEKKGIKFGENINAYTSIDETVYNLSNIPVTSLGLIDTALLVLHDWSGFVLLNDEDIDDERGVIREEWRTRNTGQYRVTEETIRNIFRGSQYEERMPIGSIDVINTFQYQALRDYYKKWYHPNLQAIIVVGDIDVDVVEKKIKKSFSEIPNPAKPALRQYYNIPDNTEPIVSIVSDPEVKSTNLIIFYKQEQISDQQKTNIDYYTGRIFNNLIASMFNQRLEELSQRPNPDFSEASGEMQDFYVAKTKQSWTIGINPRDNNSAENALRAVLTENERMRRYGFTAGELERAKTNLQRDYESAFNEREKTENGRFVDEYVAHFLNNEPCPGIEWEYNQINNLFAGLSIDRINALARSLVTDTNVVFTVTGPKKDDVILPQKEKILALWNEVKGSKVEPYTDDKISKPLLEKLPIKGQIVKTEQQPFGYTKWTLSNSVKVLIKKTDYKKDQVNLFGYSPGGTSLVKDDDLPSARVINNIATIGGVGQLSQIELGRVLTGKMVYVAPFVNGLSEGIQAKASPKDFELMMQLIYLYFTQPRTDQDAFDTWKSKRKVQLENALIDPKTSLQDTINKLATENHPREKLFNLDMLGRVDYSKTLGIYKERFANAGDFTFIITGNVNSDSIKEYVETYFGGLPSEKQNEEFTDHGIYPPKGVEKNHFSKKLETPMSTVVTMYSGEITYSLQNKVLMDYLQSILNIRYTESMREKEGGTYGVMVQGTLNKLPRERFNFRVQFDTDPAKKDKLIGIVYAEIKQISEQLPSEENVSKVKEFTLKNHQEKMIDNSYWEGAIRSWIVNGVDTHTNYEKVVKSVTPTMIRDFAKRIFSQGNIIEVSMSPK